MKNSSDNLTIAGLHSGGIITNYFCTSRCGHCLYACSPYQPKQYIDRAAVSLAIRTVKDLGCRSVHIGGGEPFLNPDGLRMVLETARDMDTAVEYVETNSSWFTDLDSARDLLDSLKELGLGMLLISMSPFHNRFIPFNRVKGVIAACRASGIKIFPWIQDFYHEIDAFDDTRTHDMDEYRDRYGSDYLLRLPSRYWIHLGGRALATYSRELPGRPVREILETSHGGCSEPADSNHFHVDLLGNYVPGLCSGLAIRTRHLGGPLPADEYPIITTLYRDGVAGLLSMARDRYGFSPAREYISKCGLCNDIREYLVIDKGLCAEELQPKDYYAVLRAEGRS